MVERTNFGKLEAVIDPPDLIEIQSTSYDNFLQMGVHPARRKRQGLQEIFTEPTPCRDRKLRIINSTNLRPLRSR